ncbi:hypothetical protein LguiA_007026 [Lonicera macranthoides]
MHRSSPLASLFTIILQAPLSLFLVSFNSACDMFYLSLHRRRSISTIADP